jgi:phage terminase small subunit
MTPKQQAFINEYARSLNGTQSAIKAGYSPKVATVIASKNLSKRSIQEAILRKRAKIEERKFISRELILDILMHEGTDMQNPARVRIYALKTAFHCLVIHEKLEKEEAEEEMELEEMAEEEEDEESGEDHPAKPYNKPGDPTSQGMQQNAANRNAVNPGQAKAS